MSLRICAFAAMAAALLAVAGCETMSAEECAAADWQALGFEDAAQRGASQLADRTESCAEKGISADADSYRRGFDDGMYQFCQPARGFQFARRGGAFNGYCPGELQRDFNYAYSDGRRVFMAEQDLQQARSEVSRLENERRELDDDIGSHERTIANPNTTEADRNRLRGELDNLRRRRRDINDDIRVAQARIPPAQRAVDDLRYEIGNRWGNWY